MSNSKNAVIVSHLVVLGKSWVLYIHTHGCGSFMDIVRYVRCRYFYGDVTGVGWRVMGWGPVRGAARSVVELKVSTHYGGQPSSPQVEVVCNIM